MKWVDKQNNCSENFYKIPKKSTATQSFFVADLEVLKWKKLLTEFCVYFHNSLSLEHLWVIEIILPSEKLLTRRLFTRGETSHLSGKSHLSEIPAVW